MKNVWFSRITIFVIVLAVLPNFLFAQNLEETYKSVESLEISTQTGDITIQKGSDNEVKVTGEWDDNKIKVKISHSGNSLKIEEKAVHKNGNVNSNASKWTLWVPDGLDLGVNSGTGSLDISGVRADVEANSGTGDIIIADMEGKFEVNSGTGSIDITNANGRFDLNSGTSSVNVSNAEGRFQANSGTGNVEFESVNPTGKTSLNSGTGNVKFVIKNKITANLALNSGTGNAVLDFHGNKIEGDFEMKCGMPSGKIIAPFKFDSEKKIGNGRNGHIEKEAKIGSADFDVEISTGTGKAEVKS